MDYFFIVPPGVVPVPVFSAEPAVGAPELLESPGDGLRPVLVVVDGFVMRPPGPLVVLPFIELPVVVPDAAGPPAADPPPAVPPEPVPVWAKADEATMTNAVAIAIVLMVMFDSSLFDLNEEPIPAGACRSSSMKNSDRLELWRGLTIA